MTVSNGNLKLRFPCDCARRCERPGRRRMRLSSCLGGVRPRATAPVSSEQCLLTYSLARETGARCDKSLKSRKGG